MIQVVTIALLFDVLFYSTSCDLRMEYANRREREPQHGDVVLLPERLCRCSNRIWALPTDRSRSFESEQLAGRVSRFHNPVRQECQSLARRQAQSDLRVLRIFYQTQR